MIFSELKGGGNTKIILKHCFFGEGVAVANYSRVFTFHGESFNLNPMKEARDDCIIFD
jgi:hypothetical protein